MNRNFAKSNKIKYPIIKILYVNYDLNYTPLMKRSLLRIRLFN